MPKVGFHVESLQVRPLVHEQQHFTGDRADEDAAVGDDGARHGIHGHGLRQGRAERVQAACARS